MPTRPPKACSSPRCPNLASGRYCPAHTRSAAEQARERERQRPSARERGYSVAWQKARAGFLAKHPRCECAEHKGKRDAPRATVVDHHEPHRGDRQKFWDHANWVPMAAPCHNRKTAVADGRWGPRKSAPPAEKKADDTVWFA